ncbi:BCCT family transporter [Egibacter rhizosphaerae]|uniref:BCCT family transporter n=1 Tax=Egibacter rhizosphaerae TaxID=1670831 RepID=A0A411YKV2_9ACTN|nr:BCCT family transporter [Egibacter rhizosphaerae]
MRPQVFGPAAGLIVLFVALGAAFPDVLADVFTTLQEQIADRLGWFYLTAMTVFLVFVGWLALSPYGKTPLGEDDDEPDYSYLSWFSMLFAAGMGIGLLFFAVAEPISHFGIDQPPGAAAEPGTAGAATEAMNRTFFHWGLHAWGVYALVGLALCYFAYRRHLPLTLRSAFYPLLGDRIQGWMGDAVDTLAIVGTLFGVATSLGIGAVQINAGLDAVLGTGTAPTIQLGLIAGITAIATGSVVLGLDRGIRRLSITTISLGGLLLLFVLLAGPSVFIFERLVSNLGTYVASLPGMSLETEAFAAGDWQADWTIFYWGWWISWSPFVGMFIARVSRGRTIREFIAGVVLVPTAVTAVVLSVLGETAFFRELFGEGGVVAAAEETLDVALFAMLEGLPATTVTSIVAILIIAAFFITSSDSGSLVDDIHASGGSLAPHKATRVFWAVAEGSVAGVLLLAGGETGLEALQQASIATGVPLAILLLAICVSITKSLRKEARTGRHESLAPESSGVE